MAAFNGERNIKFGNDFNVKKVGNFTPNSFNYDAELNILNDIFIYDVLNTPVPVGILAELNTPFSTAFNTNERFDATTYIDYIEVDYKGEWDSVFGNIFLSLPQVDNFVPAPLIPEGGQLNTYFSNAFGLLQTTENLRLPYIKKYGQFFPKVTGGYRYGGNTDY